jgi:prevent-host-death family protein
MRHVTASQFKARCLSLMDEVAATGEQLLITKHGKPVAVLGPTSLAGAPSPFGVVGGGRIVADLIEPVACEPMRFEPLR